VSSIAAGERRSLWRAVTTLVTMPRFNPLSLMNRNRGVFGLNVGHLWAERERLAEAMKMRLDDVGAGRLHPAGAQTALSRGRCAWVHAGAIEYRQGVADAT